MSRETVVEVRGLRNAFGPHVVHDEPVAPVDDTPAGGPQPRIEPDDAHACPLFPSAIARTGNRGQQEDTITGHFRL